MALALAPILLLSTLPGGLATDSILDAPAPSLAGARAALAANPGWAVAEARAGLAAQEANLALAETLLAIAHAPGQDSFDSAVALALAGTRGQADRLGLAWPEDVPAPSHASPSEALLALALRNGVTPTSDQEAKLRALDLQPEPLRASLTRLVDAFLALDDAARAGRAFSDADLPRVLAARNGLVSAAAGFRAAVDAVPLAASDPIDLCPSFALDLSGGADTYSEDCVLIVDIGGHDTYLNNAGGNGFAGCAPVPAAAVIDLSGDDAYGTSSRGCGAVGGGSLGVGFLLDASGIDTYVGSSGGVNGGGGSEGVGSLIDGGGSDSYVATGAGANGGGTFGLGFLVDAGGSDSYSAAWLGVNGGGSDGSGFLVDAAGDDSYAGSAGANGGVYATYNLGSGFLLDVRGNDLYTSEGDGFGNNGGVYGVGTGLLLDAEGHDQYHGADYGANGGSYSRGGPASGALVDLSGDDGYGATLRGVNGGAEGEGIATGLLFDGGGTDDYNESSATCNGSGTDRTVVPKCFLGAQVDVGPQLIPPI